MNIASGNIDMPPRQVAQQVTARSADVRQRIVRGCQNMRATVSVRRCDSLVFPRSLALLACCLALVLAVSPPARAASDALPEWLTASAQDGQPGLADVGWVKPRFHPEDPGMRAQWQASMQWLTARKRERTAAVRAQLAALGATATSALQEDCYGDAACKLVDYVSWLLESRPDAFTSFESFQEAARDAALSLEGFRFGIQTVWHLGNNASRLSQRLDAIQLCEEAFITARLGKEYPERKLPELSPAAREIFLLGLMLEWSKQRRAFQELADEITTRGWPPEELTGVSGSDALWLFILRSQDDPAFQLRMVSAIGPAEGSQWRYDRASLYDDVMLRIAGKQRYGSMLTCVNGRWQLSPLEDRSKVDQYRADAGLEPFAVWLKAFDDPCSG